MGRLQAARNVAIVLAIAAAVYFLPGGGRAADTFEAVLWVAFGVGIAYLGLRLYREHGIALHGLGDRYRGWLYGALALGVLALIARQRMWETGVLEIVWFALVAFVIYSLLAVFRRWRAY